MFTSQEELLLSEPCDSEPGEPFSIHRSVSTQVNNMHITAATVVETIVKTGFIFLTASRRLAIMGSYVNTFCFSVIVL